MFLPRSLLLFGSALALAAGLRAEENLWPFYVHRADAATGADATAAVGPLFFAQASPGATAEGVRPFFSTSVSGDLHEGNALYPFFTWRREPGHRSFSFFQLVNVRRTEIARSTGTETDRRFDVWPFYFSRQSPDPADSYQALFPFGGTVRNLLGKERMSFVLFPLYAEFDQHGKHTVAAPWPFLRFISGDGNEGFEFWPVYGHQQKPGESEARFWLWPLGYHTRSGLADGQPTERFGFLPFYARETAPGVTSETFAWPFFGYSDRTAPYRYHQRNYFWPLFVQGRGDDRYVNRWGPFYTHSTIKGYDKQWLLWPLFRHAQWTDGALAQEKNQFLFFVYWSLEQRSRSNPAAEPARKTHLWPLFSAWDNGAGHRQVQALSPFEVFFPNNATVRQLWTPLFALYRYDRPSADTARHALLWNAITFRRAPGEREFHVGPLFSVERTPERRRVTLGPGLVGWKRDAGGRWRLFLFDFRSLADNKAPAAKSP